MGEVTTRRFYVTWQRDPEAAVEGVGADATSVADALAQVTEAWQLSPTWVTSVKLIGSLTKARVRHKVLKSGKPV